MANTVMDRTGSPPGLWLLALMYVVYILNNTAAPIFNWIPLIAFLTGLTNSISRMLRFQWYEPVQDKLDDSDFPSESRELSGRFVRIAKHCGHAMTIKVVTDDTQEIISRLNVRSALDKKALNPRLDTLNNDLLKKLLRSSREERSEMGRVITCQSSIQPTSSEEHFLRNLVRCTMHRIRPRR